VCHSYKERNSDARLILAATLAAIPSSSTAKDTSELGLHIAREIGIREN